MNIRKIKIYLGTKIGDPIVVKYYGSRNKKEIYNGILFQLYNNIFIIKLITGEFKSFSYVDILTKTIQICI